MKQLDLGSGGTPRVREGYDAWGVDVYYTENRQVELCDIALEPLPFEDATFDLVTAYDVLEHIPPLVYLPVLEHELGARPERGELSIVAKAERRNCMIELFNEIWRVLKPGGEFYHQTPGYHPDHNSQAVWQDPTHVYVWTPETSNYFSGDYYGHHDSYGHKSDFQLVNKQFENSHWCETYRATKPAREGQYTL